MKLQIIFAQIAMDLVMVDVMDHMMCLCSLDCDIYIYTFKMCHI